MAIKKVKLNQYNGSNYDVLHPETEVSQVIGLQEAIDAKIDKDLSSLPDFTRQGETMEKFVMGRIYVQSGTDNFPKKTTIGELIDSCKDPHNKGYVATTTAVNSLSATGVQGDFCINGQTDSIWVFDVETGKYVDTDRRGQVTSVNGKTGAVTIPTYTLPIATTSRLGGVKISGSSIKITSEGMIYALRQVELSDTTPAGDHIKGDLWVQPVS